jgi:formate dehydrogenase iron-sulfur subunit
MSITRRTAIQTLAVAGAAAVMPKPLLARTPGSLSRGAVAFYSIPRTASGVRSASGGAREQWVRGHGDGPESAAFAAALTVLQRNETRRGSAFVKVQCMHCVDPACVSACMLGAMQKQADGSVTWNGDLCVGCRYCQIGCPFTLPRFEWDTPLPELTKCDLCQERRAEGELPACVDQCRGRAGLRRA